MFPSFLNGVFMVQAIGTNRIASPFLMVEGAPPQGQSLSRRVWQAVSDFFKNIIIKIKDCINYLRNLFGLSVTATPINTGEAQQGGSPKPRPPGADPVAGVAQVNNVPAERVGAPAPIREIPVNATLPERLDPYKNTPLEDVAFLKRTLAIHRAVLEGENPEALQVFNEDLEASDAEALLLVAKLLVRTFVFTDAPITYENCPEYFKTSFQNLENLKMTFDSLPRDEKLTILKTPNPSGINDFRISDLGKDVFRGIGDVGHKLVQGDRDFSRALLALRAAPE